MSDVQPPLDDNEHDTLPPSQDPRVADDIEEPPTKLGGILRKLGPGLIIAGSIVGSGELIATTKTGAQAGIVLLWLIIIGCVIKVFVQIELGRYTIGHGETTLAALDQVPGPRFRVGWIVWFWLAMMILGIGQLGGIVGGVGQAAALALPITGDYAEATRYPSATEIETFLKWDDAIITVWDLEQIRRNEYYQEFGLPTQATRRAFQSPDANWRWRVAFRTMQQLEAIGGKDYSRKIVNAADDETIDELLKDANAKLQEIAEKSPWWIFDETVSAIKELNSSNSERRNRIVRGHLILAHRLRELDKEKGSRIGDAIVAVERLTRYKNRAKELPKNAEYDLSNRIANIRIEEQERVVAAILDPPTYDDKLWAALVALITAALLYRGRYLMVQNIATVLVVAFTFITIGNVISLQMTDQWHISASQFMQGLSFQLPEAGDGITPLATALAAFGIIGVGASELIAYPYWCIEKGYAKYAGPPGDDESWARRARGWMKVMHYDAFASMIVYTIATIAFFVMGVAVLYNEGRDPDGMRMVSTLATAYVPVFGEYARWLFLIGAVAVLYSTFLVATAGNARMYTDSLKVFRLMNPHSEKAHDRALSFFSVLLPFLCLAVFCSGANPVRMILLSGAMQALLLPMIGFGALYFRFTRTDGRIKPSPLWDVLLILSFIGLFIAGTYGAYKQIVKFF